MGAQPGLTERGAWGEGGAAPAGFCAAKWHMGAAEPSCQAKLPPLQQPMRKKWRQWAAVSAPKQYNECALGVERSGARGGQL